MVPVVILTCATLLLGLVFASLLGKTIASRRRVRERADTRRDRRAQAAEITRLRCEVANLRATRVERMFCPRPAAAGVGGVEDPRAADKLRETRRRVLKTLHPDSNSDRPARERAVLAEAFKEIWPTLSDASPVSRS